MNPWLVSLQVTLPFVPSYFCGFFLYSLVLQYRRPVFYRILFAVYCLVLLTLKPLFDFHWQIYNTPDSWVYAYIIGSVMVLTLPPMLLLCFQDAWRRKLFVVFPFICIQSSIITPFCLLVMNQDWPMPLRQELPIALIFFLGSLLSCILAMLLTRRLVALVEGLPRPLYTALAVASPLVNLLFNVEQMIAMRGTVTRLEGIFQHIPLMMAEGTLMVLVFFWLVRRNSRQMVAIAAVRERMQQRNLEAQQRSLDSLRRLQVLHHQSLAEIRSMLQAGDAAGALRTVEQLTCRESQVVHRYADNPVADVSLANAARLCADAGVTLTIHGTLPRDCTLPPVDLASLLYNLFSNAAEAAAQAPKPARMEISFVTAAGRLCVTVRNPVPEHPVRRPRSEGHGFGRKILREITDRYDGSYTLDIRDGQAVATAMVWLPAERKEDAHA